MEEEEEEEEKEEEGEEEEKEDEELKVDDGYQMLCLKFKSKHHQKR